MLLVILGLSLFLINNVSSECGAGSYPEACTDCDSLFMCNLADEEGGYDCTYADDTCCPTDGGCAISTTATPTLETDSPTRATDTPTQATDSPTRVTDSPTRATDTPTLATDSPTRSTDTPTRTTGTPTIATDSPTEDTNSPTTTKTPTTTTETPTTTTETPNTTTDTPTTTTDTPTTTTETPTTTTETPTTTTKTPTTTTETPTTTTETPTTTTDTPTTTETSSPTSPTSNLVETPSPNEETPSPTWPTTRPTLQSAVKWEMIHPAYEGSHGELLWNIYYGDFSNDVRFDEFRQKEKWDIQLVKPIIQNDELFQEYRKELKVVLVDNPDKMYMDVDNASSSTKSSMSYGPMIFIVAVILLAAFGYWYKYKDGNNKIISLFTKTEENSPLLNQQTTQYVY